MILFHRPTPWDSSVECSTKVLTKAFGEAGFETAYLESPQDPINVLRKNWQTPGVFERLETTVLRPFTPVPTRNLWPMNTPAFYGARYQWISRWLKRQVSARFGADPEMVWTTVPGSTSALRKAFPSAEIAFHVIDYFPAYRGNSIKPVEARDYGIADWVFTITNTLTQYVTTELGVEESKVVTIGQGVDPSRFSKALPRPAEFSDLSHPIAIWTGVVNKGDPSLFRAAAEELTRLGGSLVLLGPPASWAVRLSDEFPTTVRCVPARSPSEIPAFLCHADIGLMLYDRQRREVYRGQNPLKLYEFASAGLGIVSTPHDEYCTLKPPVLVVDTEKDVRVSLQDLANGQGPDPTAVTSFARANDWKKKMEIILSTTGACARSD